MTATAGRPADKIRRILVAVDHRRQSGQALSQAMLLAQQSQAELVVLFVEDERLMRLAQMPFAHQIDRTSGLSSRLSAQTLLRHMSRQIEKLNGLVARSSLPHKYSASVRVVRGLLAEQAIAQSEQSDVIFINVIDRVPIPGTIARTQSRKPIADRSLRSPGYQVGVVFDSATVASRVLQVAAECASSTKTGLVVAISASGQEEADSLRAQARQLLKSYSFPVRFVGLVSADSTGVRRLLRDNSCEMLMIRADHPMLAGEPGHYLLESVSCPVVLVR